VSILQLPRIGGEEEEESNGKDGQSERKGTMNSKKNKGGKDEASPSISSSSSSSSVSREKADWRVLPPGKTIGMELLEVISLQTRIELFYQHGIGGPKGVEPVISHKPEDWIPSSDEEEEHL
jgi:hypothetical protein